jgi:hypothetical protein
MKFNNLNKTHTHLREHLVVPCGSDAKAVVEIIIREMAILTAMLSKEFTWMAICHGACAAGLQKGNRIVRRRQKHLDIIIACLVYLDRTGFSKSEYMNGNYNLDYLREWITDVDIKHNMTYGYNVYDNMSPNGAMRVMLAQTVKKALTGSQDMSNRDVELLS